MDFGMFTEFHVREGMTQADAFDEHLKEVEVAEEMGLDSVWLAEYHFAPQRSVISAPLMIGSAIAARTKRIRIGGAVFVVPLYNPLRMAEEAATLDHISKGRFEFGVGRSALTMFYRGYNLDYEETRDRFFEGLDIVLKAWTNEKFSHDGQYWQFQDVEVVPKPYQKPYPPVRVGVLSRETFALLGEMGHYISFFGAAPIPDLKEQVEEYRASWKEAGHPGAGDANMRIAVYVAETEEKARNEPEASAKHQQEYDYRVTSAYMTTPERVARSRAAAQAPYEDLLGRRLITGTPESVTDQLMAYQDELKLSGMIVEFNFGGQIPYDRVLNSMNLFCNKVVPKFK